MAIRRPQRINTHRFGVIFINIHLLGEKLMFNISEKASNWSLAIALAASVGAAGISIPAVAADDEEMLEEVVVTGSRIRRSNFTSSTPMTVISGQSLLDSGMSNLGEALRNQPSIGTGGFNQSSILSGGGATSLDLRNLGPDRVLILINGRRVASFADALANQAADLTFVPTAMVERVEILRDGASAVYGSDAITGVVNVILKDDYEGAELSFNTGVTSEGDGETRGVAMVAGINGDKGNAIFGFEVRDQDPIKQVDRDWAFPSISSLNATSFNNGSFFSPGGVAFGANGIFCTDPKAFGGNEIDDISGTAEDCPSFRSPTSKSDLARYDYGLQQDLIVDSKTISMATFINYQLTDDVNFFAEAQFAKRETTSHLDGNPGSFGTPDYPAGSFVPATNPNNPVGDAFFYFRPTSTIGPRTAEIESNTVRIASGIEGAIPEEFWFAEDWTFELSGLYTRVDADLATNSTWNLARFIRISDPDQCSVDALCSATVNLSGALDAFRPGNWTDAEVAYMRQNTLAISKFQTTSFSGVVTGPVMELPAGEVLVAAGFEIRKEDGFNKPDPTTESGESVANKVFTTEGGFDIEEFFFEVDVPVLADAPLAESVILNAQYRRSDYSNFGEEDVYRIGLNWQITSDLRVRANVSTAYRAPTVTDLFGGGTVSFDFYTDPCDNVVAGTNEAANCAIDGIGLGYSQPSSQFAALSGSNAALTPESADTWTFGVIYEPSFVEGLSLSFDIWDIEVENIITRDTSDSVLDACYGGAIGKTDVACTQFSGRSPAGIPTDFVNALVNQSGVETDGVDVFANYTFDGFSESVWDLGVAATYVAENSFSPGAGGADDRGSIPRIVANFTSDVSWKEWTGGAYVRYISAMNDPRFDGNNPFGYSGTDAYYKTDLRVSYTFDEKYRVLIGVNNAFDEDPEYIFSSGNNSDVNLYDVRGQYWFVRFDADLF
ncbi:MAG: iron complex outermembrane receptor protein [Candidatus Azotimanducaceae bacterium]